MPVIATEERWRQRSGWRDISITVQSMADLVWIFFVNARECEIGESLGRFNIKLGVCGSALSTHHVGSEEQENDADSESHWLIL
jgi:hypothetical protein